MHLNSAGQAVQRGWQLGDTRRRLAKAKLASKSLRKSIGWRDDRINAARPFLPEK
jgi:hypothetical protein